MALAYQINLGLDEAGTRVAEPITLQLLPLGTEADQSFRQVLFTPKAQLCFAIPYADLPVLWINRLSGVDARWRMSSDLTRYHDDLELGLKVYLDAQRTKAFQLNYQNGSPPPAFQFTHALSFGWNAQL